MGQWCGCSCKSGWLDTICICQTPTALLHFSCNDLVPTTVVSGGARSTFGTGSAMATQLVRSRSGSRGGELGTVRWGSPEVKQKWRIWENWPRMPGEEKRDEMETELWKPRKWRSNRGVSAQAEASHERIRNLDSGEWKWSPVKCPADSGSRKES